jgi:phosphomannomutase
MALRDITLKAGAEYHASAVGEVNVVKKMKEVNAVIGGEGNGGVIYPPLHHGRDALAGIALFLSLLAKDKRPLSILKTTYPSYQISKNKLELPQGTDVDAVIEKIRLQYEKQDNEMDLQDGLKIDFGTEWVHLRKSNTEPIIRIYAESDSMVKSESIANKIMGDIKEVLR